MMRRPPRTTRTKTLFTYTTRFRSVIERRQLTAQLLEVYLGRQTGRRVLAGAIARGETASIRAAVWYSDIKDFTVLSDLLPRQELIDLLNCRSEEHTSELQSLMRISYAVFCLKKKNKQ